MPVRDFVLIFTSALPSSHDWPAAVQTQNHEATLARMSAGPTGAVVAVVAVVAAVAAGWRGVLGAIVGGALVVVFFAVDLVLAARTRRTRASTVMGLAMLSYTTKIVLLGVGLVVFKGADWFSVGAFAAAVIAATVVWLGAQVRAFATRPMLYVEPEAHNAP